jgi:hypothetical protein
MARCRSALDTSAALRALAVFALVTIHIISGRAEPASAAPGDLIADVLISEEYPDTTSPSVAFDGRYLYHVGYGGSVLHRINVPPAGAASSAAGQVDIPIQGASSGLMTLAYDAGRNAFWAIGGDGLSMYLVSKSGTATLAFRIDPNADRPGHVPGDFPDEMKVAYDAEGDTIWYSPDATTRIYHYQTYADAQGTAVLVSATPYIDLDVAPNDMSDECGYSQSSGIAVGGAHLFVSIAGCPRLFEYTKTGVKVGSLAYAGGGATAEDLECDNVSYGVSVFWLRDGYDGHIRAIQQPARSSCGLGGAAAAAPTPTPTPTATPTPTPTATPTPTPTPTPRPTPVPTPTPLLPLPTLPPLFR